jgi:hypothetical protein
MSVVASLSPVLFLTFRSLYGISFSALGFLVLINFCSQLLIDLLFSFFSHKFNIEKAVKSIPYLAGLGFLVYGLVPLFFPDFAFGGILLGTVLFSAASGFSEVLVSPIVAALPSEKPDRDMSALHSVYAWGVVFVTAFSTGFLFLFGKENWFFLPLLFLFLPVLCAALFFGVNLPEMKTAENTSGAFAFLKDRRFSFFVLLIFFGGASECTMGQWCSGYLEKAFSIPKIWGDLFGVALLSVMLGLGRTLYSKLGKNIERVLRSGFLGAAILYLLAACGQNPILGLVSCALTGFCVSMLWPGTLVAAEKDFASGGVVMYAFLAAGGDLGASVGPQMVGLLSDFAISFPAFSPLMQGLSLSPESFGLKLGLLAAAIFPTAGFLLSLFLFRKKEKN